MDAFFNFFVENPFLWFIVFFGVFWVIGYFVSKRRIEKLHEMATMLGLSFIEPENITPQPQNVNPEAKLPSTAGKASRHFGLGTNDEWEISGTYNGTRVRLFGKSEGSGKQRETNTYVVAFFRNPLTHNFSISKDHKVIKFLSFLMPQDVKLGDQELDEKYYLKGDSPENLKKYIKHPGVEGALDELFAYSPMISVQQDGIWAKHRGYLLDEAKAREILDMITNNVRRLSAREE